MRTVRMWAPAVIFALGGVLITGVDRQQHLELRQELETAVPTQLLGLESQHLVISDAEIAVAGMDTYIMRSYGTGAGVAGAVPVGGEVSEAGVPSFTLYVGFYGSQAQGRTIHSPKNCLPGGGWEVLHDQEATVMAGGREVPVNRYLLKRDDAQVLVLYWYQGRGRVQANEYRVKLDLLKDAALHNRSDEALVRIVVPIEGSEEEAFQAAARIAGEVIPAVYTALPT